MGDDDHGARSPLSDLDGGDDFALGLAIKGGGRLVEQQDGRIAVQRARDADALTLAARAGRRPRQRGSR